MKKEALTALGLSEDQANKVIEGFGQMIPKARLDEKISQVNALTEQVKDYDSQLEELKKVDAEALQSEIAKLQEANTTAQAEFTKQLLDTQLNSEMARHFHGRVHDVDDVISKIDRSALSLVDGKITAGLAEQEKTLIESKSYLFLPDTPPATAEKKTITGVSPHKTGTVSGSEPLSVGAQFAQSANTTQTGPAKSPW